MEEIEKLRISSLHDSEVMKYHRDAAQLSYMVPERKLYVSFTINGTSKRFFHFRREVNTDNRYNFANRRTSEYIREYRSTLGRITNAKRKNKRIGSYNTRNETVRGN